MTNPETVSAGTKAAVSSFPGLDQSNEAESLRFRMSSIQNSSASRSAAGTVRAGAEFARKTNIGERVGALISRWRRARVANGVLLSRETTGPNSSVKTALRDSR